MTLNMKSKPSWTARKEAGRLNFLSNGRGILQRKILGNHWLIFILQDFCRISITGPALKNGLGWTSRGCPLGGHCQGHGHPSTNNVAQTLHGRPWRILRRTRACTTHQCALVHAGMHQRTHNTARARQRTSGVTTGL